MRRAARFVFYEIVPQVLPSKTRLGFRNLVWHCAATCNIAVMAIQETKSFTRCALGGCLIGRLAPRKNEVGAAAAGANAPALRSLSATRSQHQNVMLDLPVNKDARKRIPITTGLLDYFPAAVAAVAQLSLVGNEQHNRGERLHWARHKSSDQADTIARHLMQRGSFDEDGVRHSTKVAWRALALLQEELETVAGFTPAPETR